MNACLALRVFVTGDTCGAGYAYLSANPWYCHKSIVIHKHMLKRNRTMDSAVSGDILLVWCRNGFIAFNIDIPGLVKWTYLLSFPLIGTLILMIDATKVGHYNWNGQSDHQHTTERTYTSNYLPRNSVGHHVTITGRETWTMSTRERLSVQ